jgi:hypothetical protein
MLVMSAKMLDWSPLAAKATLLVLISLSVMGQDNGMALTGTVTDQSQMPLAGAIVSLMSNDRVLQTESSAQGQFRFDAVPSGIYDLDCKALGFVRQEVSVHLTSAGAPPLTIVLQGPSMPDIERCGAYPSIAYSSIDPKKPQLSGIVRSYENRTALPRTEVVLTRVDDPGVHFRTVANDRGRFGFEKLAPGRYDLRISRHGYLPGEMKQLLIPHENNVTVDIPLKRDDKKLILCQ